MTSSRQNLVKQQAIYLSCIVPVYNEEEVIIDFITQLHHQLSNMAKKFEILVIDDGSQDTTPEKISVLSQKFPVKLIRFSRNFGKEMAITAGLEHCSGDVVILLDADFQHPIELLPTFLQHWAKGHDMVYGIRNNRKNESAWKRNLARLFYSIMSKITQVHIPNNAGDFRLFDRKVVDVIKQFSERGRFMKGLYAWVGFKTIAVPFDVHIRAGGKSSWKFARLAELALTGITSFSDIPLRVWGYIGFTISFIALIYALYFIVKTLLYGVDVPGFPSILVGIMFFGGIQLMSIGILGEYIARIFNEVKQRPKYVVTEKIGFDD